MALETATVERRSYNMRLIDAEPIIKFIEDGLNEKDPQKHIGYDGIRIMTEIQFAPTIESQRPVWTPCDKGLPDADDIYDLDNRKQYWCTVAQRIGEEIVDTYGATMEYVQYKCGHAFWMYYGSRESLSSNEIVLAWQPLPEPYNPNKAQEA